MQQNFIYKSRKQGLPSGPVAKTLHLQCSGAQVWFLAGELRSHQKKKEKKKKQPGGEWHLTQGPWFADPAINSSRHITTAANKDNF